MSKNFQQQVQQARQSGNIAERLSFGGHYPHITPASAITEDWLFALDEAKADLAQSCRHFSNPEGERAARQAAKKHLAEIVVIAEAMAARLKNFS